MATPKFFGPLIEHYALTEGATPTIKEVRCGVCNKLLRKNHVYKYVYGASVALDKWICSERCLEMFVLQGGEDV